MTTSPCPTHAKTNKDPKRRRGAGANRRCDVIRAETPRLAFACWPTTTPPHHTTPHKIATLALTHEKLLFPAAQQTCLSKEEEEEGYHKEGQEGPDDHDPPKH
jgi:hypothetical protein